jgi:hypothetical protein
LGGLIGSGVDGLGELPTGVGEVLVGYGGLFDGGKREK